MKKAILVEFNFITRIVIDSGQGENAEAIAAKSKPAILDKAQNELSENIVGWRDDDEMPYGSGLGEEKPKAQRLYLSITLLDEGGVGVLEVNPINRDDGDGGEKRLVEEVKPKLVCALSEHLDGEVEIKTITVASLLPPVSISFTFSATIDGEVFSYGGSLFETWVYGKEAKPVEILIVPDSDDEKNVGEMVEDEVWKLAEQDGNFMKIIRFDNEQEADTFLKGYAAGVGYMGQGLYYKR